MKDTEVFLIWTTAHTGLLQNHKTETADKPLNQAPRELKNMDGEMHSKTNKSNRNFPVSVTSQTGRPPGVT